MAVLTPDTEDKREVVKQWLDSFGFTYAQCDTIAPDQEWGIATKDDSDFTIKVFWNVPPLNSILVVAEITFPDLYQQAFTFMGATDRILFLGDISRCLHAQRVGHVLLGEAKEDDNDDSLAPPKGINIYINVLADEGISRPGFFKRYFLIRSKGPRINSDVPAHGIAQEVGMRNVLPIEKKLVFQLANQSRQPQLEDEVPLRELKSDVGFQLNQISATLEGMNELLRELSQTRQPAAAVFKKTNPRVPRNVLARKVRQIVSRIDAHATVGDPSTEKRVVDEDGEFAYTVMPVRIPQGQDYEMFADDLADALIDGLTEREFVYLAIDLRYQ